jgi:hypothetical protein
MVVPFGFSVGNIIAGTSTLIQCFQAFQATGGAADKYEEAVNILNGINITLQWTKEYTDQLAVENNVDEIGVQVAHVEKAWKRMDKFLPKFDKVVPTASNPSKTALHQRFRKAFATVNWTIKDLAGEVVKLRDAVAQPMQILNHLLMLQMLYVLFLSFSFCYRSELFGERLKRPGIIFFRWQLISRTGIKYNNIPARISPKLNAKSSLIISHLWTFHPE